LFIGWNRTGWNGRRFDFWHMPKHELQVFRRFVDPKEFGMPATAQVCDVDWITPEGEVVIAERRGLQRILQGADCYALRLRNELRAPNGEVELAGDPQHAGQQFRSPQKFAPNGAVKVTYVRPEGAKDHGNDVWTGCDWIAAIQTHGDRSYTILRVEGVGNRGETTWSTRDYGRFGATRTVKVTKERPLVLEQFYVVANGARDAGWCAEQADMLRPWRPPADDHVYRTDGKVAASMVGLDGRSPDDASTRIVHHLHAPDGRLLTQGGGLRFGWRAVELDGVTSDFWTMADDCRQVLSQTLSPARLGLNAGGQHALLSWRSGERGMPVIEHRGLCVIEDGPEHHVLTVRSGLRSGPNETEVMLHGAPHEGGMLFDTAMFAADGSPEVRYLRPEGSTRDGEHVWSRADWTAALLPFPTGTVTVLCIESPYNAQPMNWSCRPDGRFGPMRNLLLAPWSKQARAESQLAMTRMSWFFVIANGERDADWCREHAARLRANAVEPWPDGKPAEAVGGGE
ncbi:MAG: PmoA family protein, partial [Planctomycetes bacterium]|nr:PmoA family protein [Planctomycetota bacterium]